MASPRPTVHTRGRRGFRLLQNLKKRQDFLESSDLLSDRRCLIPPRICKSGIYSFLISPDLWFTASFFLSFGILISIQPGVILVKEIELITISGQDAIGELSFALREASETGYHPILVGDLEDYDQILEMIEEGPPPEVTLGDSLEFDPSQLSDQGDNNESSENGDNKAVDVAGYQGVITHLQPSTGEPKPRVLIRNFKAPAAWHAFAEMAWGGWNSCPSPKVHCAVHRYWAERYGATVISITSSEVQCLVANPPTDYASALRLAREQMAYCRNAAESVAALARKLVNAQYWYFWWD